jgi:hypothetical protein
VTFSCTSVLCMLFTDRGGKRFTNQVAYLFLMYYLCNTYDICTTKLTVVIIFNSPFFNILEKDSKGFCQLCIMLRITGFFFNLSIIQHSEI